MKCPHCQNDFQAEEDADVRLARTACSPSRASYSREELEAKLREWMVKEFGNPRDYINDPDQRNAWYRDNGLLYHFICDYFPSDNVQGMAAGSDGLHMPSERTD